MKISYHQWLQLNESKVVHLSPKQLGAAADEHEKTFNNLLKVHPSNMEYHAYIPSGFYQEIDPITRPVNLPHILKQAVRTLYGDFGDAVTPEPDPSADTAYHTTRLVALHHVLNEMHLAVDEHLKSLPQKEQSEQLKTHRDDLKDLMGKIQKTLNHHNSQGAIDRSVRHELGVSGLGQLHDMYRNGTIPSLLGLSRKETEHVSDEPGITFPGSLVLVKKGTPPVGIEQLSPGHLRLVTDKEPNRADGIPSSKHLHDMMTKWLMDNPPGNNDK